MQNWGFYELDGRNGQSGRCNFIARRYCSFGITELAAAALISAGVGATTAAIAAPALIGAAVGAGGSALTGGDPLTGALTGGFTGGLAGPFGGSVGGSLGIGVEGGDALIGAASGALASGITGQDPLKGTLSGAAGGLFTGLQAGGDIPSLGDVFGSGDGIAPVGTVQAPDLSGAGNIGTIDASLPDIGSDIGGVSAGGGIGGGIDEAGLAAAPSGSALSAGSFGTSAPTGGISAASSSLTGTGAALPSGSLSSDLTAGGGFDEAGLASGGGLGGNIGGSAAPVSNVASGSTSLGVAPVGTVQAPSSLAAAPATGPISSAAPAIPKSGLFGTGITGGDLLQGGILGYGIMSQQNALKGLTAPLDKSAALTADQSAQYQKLSNDLLGQSKAQTDQIGNLNTQLIGQAQILGQRGTDLNTQAGTLAAPLTSGSALPAGAEQSIINSVNAAKAKTRSTYASLGLSGSTMEAQALSQIDDQASAQRFAVQDALYKDSQTATGQALDAQKAGITTLGNAQNASATVSQNAQNTGLNLLKLAQNGTQLDNQLYETILNTQLAQDQNLSNAISNFSAQMLGTPSANKSLTLKVA